MVEPGSGESSPEEWLALAEAMAYRSAEVEIISERISTELWGAPYQPKSEAEIRERHLARTAFNLAIAENPGLVLSVSDIMAAGLGIGPDGQATSPAGDVDALVDYRTDAVKHSILVEIADKAGVTGENSAAQFSAFLAKAREVASEQNTTVADVYIREELFDEVARRAASPLEFAETSSQVVGSFSRDLVIDAMVQAYKKDFPQQLLDVLPPEEIDALFKISIVNNLENIDQGIFEITAECLRQAYYFLFIRIYGEHEFDQLPSELKQILTPQKPLAKSVFGENS